MRLNFNFLPKIYGKNLRCSAAVKTDISARALSASRPNIAGTALLRRTIAAAALSTPPAP